MTPVILDRRDVLSQLFLRPNDYLFVTGLAGSARDDLGPTNDEANLFTTAGGMGATMAMGWAWSWGPRSTRSLSSLAMSNSA